MTEDQIHTAYLLLGFMVTFFAGFLWAAYVERGLNDPFWIKWFVRFTWFCAIFFVVSAGAFLVLVHEIMRG